MLFFAPNWVELKLSTITNQLNIVLLQMKNCIIRLRLYYFQLENTSNISRKYAKASHERSLQLPLRLQAPHHRGQKKINMERILVTSPRTAKGFCKRADRRGGLWPKPSISLPRCNRESAMGVPAKPSQKQSVY